jgi:hypothetical protein
MKKFLTILSGLLSSNTQANANTSPEQLVKAFQAEYLHWNMQALELDSKHGNSNTTQSIERGYQKLLQRYTQSGFKGEPIAYSSEPSHDPSQENIISSEVTETNAIIRTELPRKYYTPTYEYHLVKMHERWFLTQIYLVDNDGLYPSL